MSTKLTITDNRKTYVLEFTRDTVSRMERAGFVVQNFGNAVMNDSMMLWNGAFLANHPNVSTAVKDALWEKMGNKADLLQKLMEMYTEPLTALMADPDDKSGELSWKVSK